MPIIYHVTSNNDWNAARQKGFYEHPSLNAEGFIHCSQDHQVAAVLERYFAGKTDLIKLVIDTDKLTSKYVFDWSPSAADTFPHIYGPINTSAVIDTIPL
ncbi:MAG: DUF952 domain-containing protein [Chitinophagaceae bacterium]